MSTSAPAILVRDLRKAYGEHEAVRGIDFEVARGEVFGLLGPNGAGKTTTVEILEGYRARTSGIVSVLGHDPEQRSRELRERVGIVLQSTGMYRHITPREAVAPLGRASTRTRATSTRSSRSPACRRRRTRYVRTLSRRPAAPAGPRARARRRPRADLPRRADDRLRPGRAPRRLGGRSARCRSSARRSCSRRTTSTRRRRCATAWRSSRRGGSSPRARPASSARRRRATAWPGATSDGELHDARDRGPDRAAAPADERGAGPRRARCATCR